MWACVSQRLLRYDPISMTQTKLIDWTLRTTIWNAQLKEWKDNPELGEYIVYHISDERYVCPESRTLKTQ